MAGRNVTPPRSMDGECNGQQLITFAYGMARRNGGIALPRVRRRARRATIYRNLGTASTRTKLTTLVESLERARERSGEKVRWSQVERVIVRVVSALCVARRAMYGQSSSEGIMYIERLRCNGKESCSSLPLWKISCSHPVTW